MQATVPVGARTQSAKGLWHKITKSRYLLLLFLPCFLYFVFFKYIPMWGILLSFKDFKPFIGFLDSPWVGLKHYVNFFQSPDCFRLFRNTFLLGVYSVLWSFPMPILFALCLNEVKSRGFKKLTQTISYIPHFLSVVIVCGMVNTFLSPIHGIVNEMIAMFGMEKINFLNIAKYFRTIYVASDVWQGMGWGAIIYLAALTNIDPGYYEAAKIDGAGRFKQMAFITLPCLAPTIITMLLLRMGSVLEVGLEKVLLLYNPAIYETADVISTYVYRQGIGSNNYSYASAVGLFNSIVNLLLLVAANLIAKKFSETSLF